MFGWERLVFGWLNPMLRKGSTHTLEAADLPPLPQRLTAVRINAQMSTAWDAEVASGRQSLRRVVFGILWRPLLLGVVLHGIALGLDLARATFLQYLLQSLSASAADHWTTGLWWAGALAAAATLSQLSDSHGQAVLCEVACRIRTGLVDLIYRKVVHLESTISKGTIVTLYDTEASRIDWLAFGIHRLACAPAAIIIALMMLARMIGWAAAPAFLVCIALIPINYYLAQNLETSSDAMQEWQQRRMRLVSETMQGVLATKLFGWESAAGQRIQQCRSQELTSVRQWSSAVAWLQCVLWIANLAMALTSFVMFSLLGGELEASIVFPCVLLFEYMMWIMLELPEGLSSLITFVGSLRRIEELLTRQEVASVPTQTAVGTAVTMDDVTLSWPVADDTAAEDDAEGDTSDTAPLNAQGFELVQVQERADDATGPARTATAATAAARTGPVLHRLQLQIKKQELVAVVGRVGAGKSSMLMALLGELQADSGRLAIQGSIAYVPQQAWVRSMTIRDNILCGAPYEEERYRQALHACALAPDLAALPAGDLTQVGERGVTLSGGQKQRLSLARAVYADADVYLLDDPLSAVDARVGNWLFEKCVCGVLSSKTRILVTHQIQYLPRVDRVVVLDNGSIAQLGSYTDLMQRGVNFASLQAGEHAQDAGAGPLLRAASGDMAPADVDGAPVTGPQGGDDSDDEGERQQAGQLVTAEDRAKGAVGLSVYLTYAKLLGSTPFLGVFLLLNVFLLAVQSLSSAFVAQWATFASAYGNAATVAVYLSLGLFYSILTLIRHLSWFKAAFKASQGIHEKLVTAVLRSPMQFFYTTPLGRILNRFSRDQNIVDQHLPDHVSDLIWSSVQTIESAIIVVIIMPLFGLVLPVIVWMYYRWTTRYTRSAREIQRLEAVSCSPLQVHFSETVDGLACVRAFRMQSAQRHQLHMAQDANNQFKIVDIYAQLWMMVRLEICGSLLVFAVSALAASAKLLTFTSPALLGLVISITLNNAEVLKWFSRTFARTEMEMARLERLLAFCELPPEAPLLQGRAHVTTPVPPQWPREGSIEFQNVVMRYRPTLEPALAGVSFSVRHGEKVGVVGRTGAGKSSLLMALFRVVEPESGTIAIDGVDITTIGLWTLRQGVSIIPQDPVLLAGSVRWNLDPLASQQERKYDDTTLWTCLEHVGLKTFIQSLPGGLDHELREGATNMSVGQRQLLCLARALLRRSQVLVMDEATASIDPESDALIQNTIRTEFQGRTVLTIAHRLPTIIDYDRILVMGGGRVVEYDTPAALLDNPASQFFDMVAQTGPVAAAFLHNAAKCRFQPGAAAPIVRMRSLGADSTASTHSSLSVEASVPAEPVPDFDQLVAAAAAKLRGGFGK